MQKWQGVTLSYFELQVSKGNRNHVHRWADALGDREMKAMILNMLLQQWLG